MDEVAAARAHMRAKTACRVTLPTVAAAGGALVDFCFSTVGVGKSGAPHIKSRQPWGLPGEACEECYRE